MVDHMARVVGMEADSRRIPPTWYARNRMLNMKFRAVMWDEGKEWLDFNGKEGDATDEAGAEN
ncbi:hypothetical protein B0T18DRAFT_422450, partial [Schizothecium vesticola]